MQDWQTTDDIAGLGKLQDQRLFAWSCIFSNITILSFSSPAFFNAPD